MFIKLDDVTDEKGVDVRTKSEFYKNSIFDCNIPIINEKEHARIKKMYPFAFFIIYLGLRKRKEKIKLALIEASENKKRRLVIGCSRGRLRSPFIYFYAKSLGIDCKILSKGIKRYFEPSKKSIKSIIASYFDFE